MWLVEGQIRFFMADAPTIMNDMMQNKDPKKLAQVTEAFLKMKKFNIAELIKANEK